MKPFVMTLKTSRSKKKRILTWLSNILQIALTFRGWKDLQDFFRKLLVLTFDKRDLKEILKQLHKGVQRKKRDPDM